MKSGNANEGCSCNSGCCGSEQSVQTEKKLINIDFLFLDLNVCVPCQGTDKSLDDALTEVSKVLDATGVEVRLNKINVTSEEIALNNKFVSSPTIRVNGRDIQMEVKESLCKSCGDLCGDDVNCRVWVYQGKEYSIPPKALIIEAILKEVYGGNGGNIEAEQKYVMPENLKKFYAAIDKKQVPNQGS